MKIRDMDNKFWDRHKWITNQILQVNEGMNNTSKLHTLLTAFFFLSP